MPPDRHRAQRVQRHPPLAAREQELDHRRGRELRRAGPEAAVLGGRSRAEERRPRASSDAGSELALGRRSAGGAVRAAARIRRPVSIDLRRAGRATPRATPTQHLRPGRHPLARLGREVGAGVERHAVGREEHVQRPAAAAGHRLDGVHVDRVDVGALLAVDLDADEALVHQRRDLAGPRSTRAPSRGTSGRRRSRSRRGSACPPRARAPSASSPHGYQSTGLSACWSRYGEVSCGESVGHTVPLHVPSSRNGHRARRAGRRRPLLARRQGRRADLPVRPDAGRSRHRQARRGLHRRPDAPLPRQPRDRRGGGRRARSTTRSAAAIYVTDISTFKDVNEAYGSYFGDAPPARSTIGVASLPLGAEVEIDAILAVPD